MEKEVQGEQCVPDGGASSCSVVGAGVRGVSCERRGWKKAQKLDQAEHVGHLEVCGFPLRVAQSSSVELRLFLGVISDHSVKTGGLHLI